jgi:drug/metabolite transporter (DMT)-like permease
VSNRNLAIIAAFFATLIYGLNHTIAKEVMPTYVQPFGFIFLRVSGAAVLFWMIAPFAPKQKIDRSDWWRIIVCAIMGMVINMLAFFKGLQLSTPINSAVLVTITPIIVVVLSALFIKEKITLTKGLGVLLGLIGAVTLILFGAEIRSDAPNIPLGNFLFVVNATFYGSYLILVKKLIEKYHPLVLLKWLFTVAVFVNFPLTFSEVLVIEWAALPLNILGAIIFVVLGTTFGTYLLNAFALTQLKASTIGAFVYMQPLVGVLFALFAGKDQLTGIKLLAMTLVLLGVYLASKKIKPNV